ncbi:solute carrier family 35 member F4 [Clupea harengus]|uniref:Solute carrier family 35 member F4 n=1 Tax=Clupea harengus TaxID=7950 RepID=A0A6P8FWM7_CLUHA|nr:solute carrier family 35 member F4 [Clupea harengus]
MFVMAVARTSSLDVLTVRECPPSCRTAMHRLSAKVSPSPEPGPITLQLPTARGDNGRSKTDQQSDTLDGESSVKDEDEESEAGTRDCCTRCPLKAMRKVMWGLVLGGCVALSWAGATHSAKQTLAGLHAPYFITWFCSVWNLLLFPIYYLGHLLGAEQKQWPTTCFRECSSFLGDGRVTVRLLLKGAAPFSVLWSLSGYLYLLALHRISTSDASAVLCCSQAFIFLLSWIGLKDHFMGVRIVAAILSITGIVMMAYADGFHSDSITGVALGVGSASTSALYKVLFRKRVGEFRPGPASVLLSCVGLFSCVLHSWVCVLLYLTHVEYWPTSQAMPWKSLCIMASLLLAFNMLVNLGVALTYPCLISLGVLLSIPASTAVDILVTSSVTQLSQVRIAAAGIIAAGYVMLLLPENWDENTLRCLGKLWQGGWREDSVIVEELTVDSVGPTRTKPKPAGVAALLHET